MEGVKTADQIKTRMPDKVRVIEEVLILGERADPELFSTTQMLQAISSLIFSVLEVSTWSSWDTENPMPIHIKKSVSAITGAERKSFREEDSFLLDLM